jgi:DNA-3-methyladenine glycosylase II
MPSGVSMPKLKSPRVIPGVSTDIEGRLTHADPELGRLIEAVVSRVGRQRPPKSKATPLQSLIRAVIYQRMAATAADTIYKRLSERLTGDFFARNVLRLSVPTLRSVGLSADKAAYVRNLAQWFADNPAKAKSLSSLSDEAIHDALSVISGIGAWTVNVFLIFTLQRPDVMPASDLGIRRGLQLADGLAAPPSARAVIERAELWRPYRSVASVYLWNSVRLKLTTADLKSSRAGR